MLILGYSILLVASVTRAQTNAVYFQVAPVGVPTVPNLDSYVLPLFKPEHVAQARQLILATPANGNDKIVVARIAAGKDGINRDYLAPGCPEWSWHVTEFGGFYDITAEILDGSPRLVEEDVDGWIRNTGGLIGFWLYGVVRELGPEPICLSVKTNSSGLLLTWHGVSTNYVYTLESTDSPSTTNWTPVAGGPWPSKTNQWILPRLDATHRFFRVKAELQP